MHQCAPFGLAQPHWFETLVELLPPCTSRAVQQLTQRFSRFAVGHMVAPKLFMRLTNSRSASLSISFQKLLPRSFSNLPCPPETKRDAKAESEARLYRM